MKREQDLVEAAQMFLDQVLRDIGACMNYKSMPLLERNLIVAIEELAFAMATRSAK